MIRRALAIVVAYAVSNIMINVIDGVLAEQRMHDQHSNHARFEGTWTPYEQRLRVAGRELDRFERGMQNHAAVHGVSV